MELAEGWWLTEHKNTEFHQVFLDQLHRELAPAHPLYDLPVKMLARCDDNDDVLFEILDSTPRVAQVHLTWIKKEQSPPYPHTKIFKNFDDSLRRMVSIRH